MASLTDSKANAALLRATNDVAVSSMGPVRAAGKTLRYLAFHEYPAWDALVELSSQGSLFCQSWYLNAVGGRNRILGYFENGRLVAGIPLHYERRLGGRLCCMPKLTPAWGVIIEALAGKPVTIAAREMEILSVFAERLSSEKIFIQAFHPSLTNWLPLRWSGFRQSSRFTYILNDLSDCDRVWNEMAEGCRRQIRKAERQGIRVQSCDSETVFNAARKTFQRQKTKVPFSAADFDTLCRAAAGRDAGRCFAAQDSSGRVHAAALLLWDTKRAYYTAGGGDPVLRTSGATSLLIWHLIQFSASRSAIFDFEGSDNRPIGHFFRSFGATLQPYNYITKFPRWLAALLAFGGRI